MFVFISGSASVRHRNGLGDIAAIVDLGPGDFLAEVGQLSGRSTASAINSARRFAVRTRSGFVRTGGALAPDELAETGRPPMPLESSVYGVFAVGDVRAGSVKRVGGAIGEGAAVVPQLHDFLSGQRVTAPERQSRQAIPKHTEPASTDAALRASRPRHRSPTQERIISNVMAADSLRGSPRE